MKDRQGAGQFSMRGLGACRGELHLHAAVHNLRKLHRESVRRRAAVSQPAGNRRIGHALQQGRLMSPAAQVRPEPDKDSSLRDSLRVRYNKKSMWEWNDECAE
jgi:hypothetical protein